MTQKNQTNSGFKDFRDFLDRESIPGSSAPLQQPTSVKKPIFETSSINKNALKPTVKGKTTTDFNNPYAASYVSPAPLSNTGVPSHNYLNTSDSFNTIHTQAQKEPQPLPNKTMLIPGLLDSEGTNGNTSTKSQLEMISKLKDENRKLTLNAEMLEKRNADLRNELDSNKRHYESQLKDQHEQVQDYFRRWQDAEVKARKLLETNTENARGKDQFETRSGDPEKELKLLQEIAKLKIEISDKTNEIERLYKENRTLTENHHEAENAMQNLKREKEMFTSKQQIELVKIKQTSLEQREKILRLEQTLDELKMEMSQREKEFENTKKDNERLKRENKATQEIYSNLKNQTNHISTTSQLAEIELEQYRSKFEILEKENKTLRETIAAFENGKSLHEKEKRELRTKMEREKIELTKEIDQLTNQFTSATLAHKELTDKLQTQIRELQRRFLEADQEKDKTFEGQTKFSLENQTLKLEQTKLQDEINFLKKRIDDIISDKNSEIDGLILGKENLSKRIHELQEKLLESSQKNKQLGKEIESLQKKLVEADLEKEDINKKWSEMMQTSTDLRHLKDGASKLVEKEREIKALQRAIETKDKTIVELQDRIQDIEATSTRIRLIAEMEAKKAPAPPIEQKPMEEVPEDINRNYSQDRLQHEVLSLQQQIERMKVSRMRFQIGGFNPKELEEEMATLSVQNENLLREVFELRQKLADVDPLENPKEIIERLRRLVNQLEDERYALEKKLEKSKEEIETCTNKIEELVNKNSEFEFRLTEAVIRQKVFEASLIQSKGVIGEITNIVAESRDKGLWEKVIDATTGM